MSEPTYRVEGKTIYELKQIVAADNERFRVLADLWDELTLAEQNELIATAKEMAKS